MREKLSFSSRARTHVPEDNHHREGSMTYLRNNTTIERWLEDPRTGIQRRVEAHALVGVTLEVAQVAQQQQPGVWELVTAIALPPV